jgi:hypothetical protein
VFSIVARGPIPQAGFPYERSLALVKVCLLLLQEARVVWMGSSSTISVLCRPPIRAISAGVSDLRRKRAEYVHSSYSRAELWQGF